MGGRLLVFAGTTEGRLLAEALTDRPVEVTVCVATGYGGGLLSPAPGRTVRTGRLDRRQMAQLMREGGFGLVVDATHPYAAQATDAIAAAAKEAGLRRLRLLRAGSDLSGCATAADTEEAVRLLAAMPGNVLLTTGSKELAAYTALPDYAQRLYVRVLPSVESLSHCLTLGFLPAHILAMQGPFSAGLNAALLRQWDIATLVTKDGGAFGGFEEKLAAARQTGARLLVIGRPLSERGEGLAEILSQIDEWLEGTRCASH